MKHLRRNWMFLKALVVAAIFSINKPSGVFSAGKMILRGLFSKRGERASRELYIRRMMRCQHCVIYDRNALTCGSPNSENPQLGCKCFQPYKSAIASARCWLDENTDVDTGYGWRES